MTPRRKGPTPRRKPSLFDPSTALTAAALAGGLHARQLEVRADLAELSEAGLGTILATCSPAAQTLVRSTLGEYLGQGPANARGCGHDGRVIFAWEHPPIPRCLSPRMGRSPRLEPAWSASGPAYLRRRGAEPFGLQRPGAPPLRVGHPHTRQQATLPQVQPGGSEIQNLVGDILAAHIRPFLDRATGAGQSGEVKEEEELTLVLPAMIHRPGNKP